MRKINKGYVIIYIDDEQSLLSERDFVSKDIQSQYYSEVFLNNPEKPYWAIQWNYYIIIPSDNLSEEKIKEIQNNESYARKYVIKRDEIDAFIEGKFSESETKNKLLLITGNSWEDAKDNLSKFLDGNPSEHKFVGCNIYGSFHRDYNSLDTLEMLDDMRVELINGKSDIIFYSHLENEIHLIEKKFAFLNEGFVKYEDLCNTPITQ